MRLNQKIIAISAVAALAALNICRAQMTKAGTQGGLNADFTNDVAIIKRHSYETKDQAVAATQKALADMNAKIDALALKSTNYTGEAKVHAAKALDKLHTERDVAARKLAELKSSSEHAWNDASAGFDKAWQKLAKTYDKVQKDFQQ